MDYYVKLEHRKRLTEVLQCSICKGSLSSGPIRLSSDGSNICSQCSASSDTAEYRNFALEFLLNDATFPCIFNKDGCSERPLFGKVIEHQQECRYSPIACASLPFTTCTWKGPVNEVPDHFNQKHSDLVKKEANLQLEINNNSDGILMVVQNKFPFLVKYSYESKMRNLHYNVAYFKYDASAENICQIRLSNATNYNYTIRFEAAECLLYNGNFFLEDSKALVCLEKFLEILNNPLNIRVELILPKYTYQNISQPKVDYEFLESKKCKKCGDFVIPPFFLYEGNNICSDCSHSCEGCKPNTDEELFNILVNQNYPCRWHGCEHIVRGDAIRSHVNKCKYRIYVCRELHGCSAMLKLTEMIEHLQKLKYRHFVHDFTHRLIYNRYTTTNYYSYTIVENELIIIQYYIEYSRNKPFDATTYYKLYTSNVKLDQYTVKVCIEHDHCKRVSKVFLFNRSLTFERTEFPKCFSLGDEFSVTVTVS